MAKTYEEILDEMPNRVKECDALEEILFIRTCSVRYGVGTRIFTIRRR